MRLLQSLTFSETHRREMERAWKKRNDCGITINIISIVNAEFSPRVPGAIFRRPLWPHHRPSTHAILVEDLGVRKGKPVHIALSTGFNGVVGAGIKSLRVDGVIMDGFCIDPFTRA